MSRKPWLILFLGAPILSTYGNSKLFGAFQVIRSVMIILLLYQKSMDVAVCQQSFIAKKHGGLGLTPRQYFVGPLALNFSKPEYLYSDIIKSII